MDENKKKPLLKLSFEFYFDKIIMMIIFWIIYVFLLC